MSLTESQINNAKAAIRSLALKRNLFSDASGQEPVAPDVEIDTQNLKIRLSVPFHGLYGEMTVTKYYGRALMFAVAEGGALEAKTRNLNLGVSEYETGIYDTYDGEPRKLDAAQVLRLSDEEMHKGLQSASKGSDPRHVMTFDVIALGE